MVNIINPGLVVVDAAIFCSEERWREVITKFWGYITLIDDAIGDFLDFLEENGLYGQTFIALTADHGDAMGAHRMIEKGEFMFDSTYHIPLIIRDPASGRSNVRDENLVYLHDLTPTAYDAAGKAIPESFESRSLLPIVREGADNGRKGVLCQLAGHFVSFEQRMWRRKDYKLVFNASDLSELYDVVRDPGELDNLFYDPDYVAVKKEMLEEMRTEMERIGDPLENWLYRVIEEI
ncbi:sulfatase/phosphatase domain-containing protein [Lachnoclostridium sp. Marseille-P6806]|uniref:sulfatase/phosphatase domain-containing protein n=1 Tax=Lachnoclostridium sp. Marseille-P6806 TaxID=2364793 RepID=UPI001A92FCB0|nr:sulfatase/phosphatase domain-containing protein [Lachnoclostridium sp. Marseille-P6806]